jgi:hypothetical protein
MAGEPFSFHCPNCGAFYQVVKVEAGPETVDRNITCCICCGSLDGRDGIFIVKYFLLRKAGCIQRRNKPARYSLTFLVMQNLGCSMMLDAALAKQ